MPKAESNFVTGEVEAASVPGSILRLQLPRHARQHAVNCVIKYDDIEGQPPSHIASGHYRALCDLVFSLEGKPLLTLPVSYIMLRRKVTGGSNAGELHYYGDSVWVCLKNTLALPAEGDAWTRYRGVITNLCPLGVTSSGPWGQNNGLPDTFMVGDPQKTDDRLSWVKGIPSLARFVVGSFDLLELKLRELNGIDGIKAVVSVQSTLTT